VNVLFPHYRLLQRCPACQETLMLRTLSYFELGNGTQTNCPCGAHPAYINRNGGYLQVSLQCPVCPERHSYIITEQNLRGQQDTTLTCPNMDLELLHIGNSAAVAQTVYMEGEMVEECADEFEDFFADTEVMSACLKRLSELIATDHVYCADCDCHDMNMLIMAGHLEIRCDKCGVVMNIYAGSPADLHLLNNVEQIFIEGGRSKVRFMPPPEQPQPDQPADAPQDSAPTDHGPLN